MSPYDWHAIGTWIAFGLAGAWLEFRIHELRGEVDGLKKVLRALNRPDDGEGD